MIICSSMIVFFELLWVASFKFHVKYCSLLDRFDFGAKWSPAHSKSDAEVGWVVCRFQYRAKHRLPNFTWIVWQASKLSPTQRPRGLQTTSCNREVLTRHTPYQFPKRHYHHQLISAYSCIVILMIAAKASKLPQHRSGHRRQNIIDSLRQFYTKN